MEILYIILVVYSWCLVIGWCMELLFSYIYIYEKQNLQEIKMFYF